MNQNQQKGVDLMLRAIYDYDKLCFKKCIQTPDKKLTSENEECLKMCMRKVVRSLEVLRLSDQKEI